MDQCGAKTRAGTPCANIAGHGTSHVGTGRCKMHGGSSPNAEVAGTVELARREAKVMGQPLPIDPHDAMLQCIHITAGEVQYASERIADLETAMVSTMFGPKLDTWIEVRQRAMDRLVIYSKTAISAGIAERQIRIAEAQGQLLATAVRNILTALGVADHPEAPVVVRRELTAIAGGLAA